MKNRIDIKVWRERGDDDDSLWLGVFAAGAADDFHKDIAALCNIELNSAGEFQAAPDGDKTVFITSEMGIVDGEVLEYNGRKFRINITEVTCEPRDAFIKNISLLTMDRVTDDDIEQLIAKARELEEQHAS